MMKRYAMLASIALVFAGACGDDDNPNGPTPPTPQPTTIVFTANMTAAQEVPPITNADRDANGTATITFNLTRDAAGTITAANINFVYNLRGFPAGTQIRLSHIHTGAAGIGGGVLIDTGLSAANPVPLAADGTGTLTFSNVAPPNLDAVNAVIANPAGYYFNVHSVLNPGGAVRGQLVRQ
jgi:hypothetical protein